MNILFRTSGGRTENKELGMGHVFRSINLAKEFNKNNIYFLIQDYGGVIEKLESNGYKNNFVLSKNISSDLEIKKIINIIKENSIDIIIFDQFKIDVKILKTLKNIIKTVLITDLKKYNFPASLVVNGFIGFENQIKKNSFGSVCLLGPSFQILNKNFRKNKKVKKKFSIILSFGGNDEKKIIEKTLDVFLKYSIKYNYKIILGPATKRSNTLKKYENLFHPKSKIIQYSNNMYKDISESKFGFCSGGITSYEFAAVGIPFGIICQVPHQLITAKKWDSLRIGKNLGLFNNDTYLKIKKILDSDLNLLKFYRKNKIIDGFGAKRVAMEIKKL